MQDIVFKKVEHTSGSDGQNELLVFTPPPISLIERTLNFLNRIGGWFHARLGEYQPEIVTPAHEVHLRPQPKKEKVPMKKRAHSLANKVKEKGKAAKRSLKTPIGKVALVHSTALLALFVLVLSQNPRFLQNTARSVETSLGTDTVRQYLPRPQDAIQPQKFQEQQLVTDKSQPQSKIDAWITPWNITDMTSTAASYQSVSAFWLTLGEDGYSLTPKADWSAWQQFRNSFNNPDQKKFVTVSADPNLSYLGLANPDIQSKEIANLLQTVHDQNFDGIDIDYEGLTSDNRDLFTTFIRNLSTAFHAANKEVAVTVEARIGNNVPMDWRNLGLIADEIRIMAYDYHSRNTGFPGAIAPLGWVKDVTDYAISLIDPKKVVIGLGNYGYDWQKTADANGQTEWQGTGLSFDQAVSLAKDKKAPIIEGTGIDDRGYDIGLAPTFTYMDDSGNQHAVWFEDKDSLQKKVELLNQYPIHGIIFWSIGLGDTSFWQNLQN